MRIVTWNCESGFQKKTAAFLTLEADIAVVPECTEAASKVFPDDQYRSLWFGDPKSKGMAIFYKPEWSILPLASHQQHKWIIPLQVSGPESFTLVAVWTLGEGPLGYVEKLRAAFAENERWFEQRPVVVAGDFNSNVQWDRAPHFHHASLVKQLSARELISLYHSRFDKEHGNESVPTYHRWRKIEHPYHIDYIFISDEWRQRVTNFEIGSFTDWSQYSDHCPLSVDIANNLTSQLPTYNSGIT